MALNTQHEAGTAAPHTVPEPSLLADITQATEEQRQLQQIEVDMTYAAHLSRVPALTGTKGKSKEEQEQAKYEAFAKIQAGREVGLQPMESLRAFYFDQNGIGMDVHTRVALALRTGNHRFAIRKLSATEGEIQWFVKRAGQWEGCTPIKTSREQLKHIQVWEYDKKKGQTVQIPITEKWNYKSWMEDMIYRYIQVRNIRRYAPETQGSYAVQPQEEADIEDAGIRENGDVPTDAAIYGGEPAEETPAETFDRLAQDTGYVPQAERVDTTTGEITEPAEMPRPVLLSAVTVACKEAAFTPKPFRVWLQSQWPSKSRLAECTDDELRQVLGHLQQYGTDALTRDFDPVAEQAEMPLGDPQVPAKAREVG